MHDFLIPAQGKAVPYGVYDLTRNAGWVSVGIDHDTASFAVRTIGRWWQKMGRPRYRRARSLLITADAGGSNGARLRLWKTKRMRFVPSGTGSCPTSQSSARRSSGARFMVETWCSAIRGVR